MRANDVKHLTQINGNNLYIVLVTSVLHILFRMTSVTVSLKHIIITVGLNFAPGSPFSLSTM